MRTVIEVSIKNGMKQKEILAKHPELKSLSNIKHLKRRGLKQFFNNLLRKTELVLEAGQFDDDREVVAVYENIHRETIEALRRL